MSLRESKHLHPLQVTEDKEGAGVGSYNYCIRNPAPITSYRGRKQGRGGVIQLLYSKDLHPLQVTVTENRRTNRGWGVGSYNYFMQKILKGILTNILTELHAMVASLEEF